jgi:uncharacterized membrane protein
MAASASIQRRLGNPVVIGGTQPNPAAAVLMGQEYITMLIFMLAAAMTVTMLIATIFGLHQEAERLRFDHTKDNLTPFGPR